MPSDLIRDRTGAAPYVTPILDALDRMEERSILRPDQVTRRARLLAAEKFGSAGGGVDAAFSHGGTGLLGEHTHYFDGFALLMPLPFGTAVALRMSAAAESQIVFEGSSERWSFDLSRGTEPGLPTWVSIVVEIARRMAPPETQIQAAIVSTMPSSCVDAYVGALAMATARTCQSVFARSESNAEIRETARRAVETCLDLPYGIGYVMAADTDRPDAFSLIDTLSLEQLAVDAPSRELVGWGLVDVRMGLLRDPSFHQKMRAYAEEATAVLRKKGFASMSSLRDLEHRDLKTALEALPRRHRPVVRHLVTENRRVQKLVAAVRRRDWQMFGALLFMSHASLRKEWESTNAFVDLVVRETEELSLEGMYGARSTGRGGTVIVVGQPFVVPRCLDRIQTALREQFEIDPDVMLL